MYYQVYTAENDILEEVRENIGRNADDVGNTPNFVKNFLKNWFFLKIRNFNTELPLRPKGPKRLPYGVGYRLRYFQILGHVSCTGNLPISGGIP